MLIVVKDLLPAIKIRTKTDPKILLESLYKISQVLSNLYLSEYKKDYILKNSNFLVLRPKKQNGHLGIIAQIFSLPEINNSLQVEIRAQRWSKVPATYKLYVEEAKRILNPLISKYNAAYNSRKRLSIQSALTIQKSLPPLANKLFMTFVDDANKSLLNSMDWKRFYKFIRHCHASNVKLYPDELKRLLIENGFSDDDSDDLTNIFYHGKNLLKTYIH